MFHTLFFDLDNTLYPKSSGLMDAIRDRIILYMKEKLCLEEQEILVIRKYSLKKYGTTLLGLKEHFEIDEYDYLDYVHDINLHNHLIKDDHLKELLESFPQRKFIFTNADSKHVNQILDFMDINHLFEGIIDIHIMMPFLKPHEKAFHTARQVAQLPDWDGCAFLDDHLANIEQARRLGIFSILIDEDSQIRDNLKIASIYDLPTLIQTKL